MKKFKAGKTKVVCSIGFYVLFWRHAIRCGLRDDFGVPINTKREFWLTFVPLVTLIHWWGLLDQIKKTQERVGMTDTLSVGHAFFLSAFWFASVPYVNKHINALYEFRANGMGAASSNIPGFQPAPR